MTASESPEASSDDEAVPVIHMPGRGHRRRNGSDYIRDVPKANSPRSLQVRPRSPVTKAKQRKHRLKIERKTLELIRHRSSGPDNETLARQARTNFSLLSHLGAGRIDPFNVYVVQQDLPAYVHGMLDHAINSACKAYVPSEKMADLETVRSQLMDNIMSDSLAWYSVMMSAITHHAYMLGRSELPHRERLLRMSYRTKTISLIQEDMKAHSGIPSESGLLGIATLIVHGGTASDRPFVHDKVQERKAFGTANDMHYYSSMELDHTHWLMLARFVRNRGGAAAVKLKAMAMVLASADALTAWRTLSKPIMEPFVPTALAIIFAPYQPDDVANVQLRKLLSGLPIGFRTCPEAPHANLYAAMQHVRTLVVRFNQWQRRKERGWRPDLRQIHLTRVLVMHDLLSLDSLETDGKGLPMTYELSRHASLAFMQLVLFPIAKNNDVPSRLLQMMLPLLQHARATLREQEVARGMQAKGIARSAVGEINTGIFLWVWILAGMLALEELQTKGNSDWMDELAPYIVDMPIKAERRPGPWSRARCRRSCG